MPDVKTNAKVTVKKSPAKKEAEELRVLWPELTVTVYDSSGEFEPPISMQKAMDMLGWEDESAYAERVMRENPKIKAEQAVFTDYLLKDETEKHNKVVCWYNQHNRPFDEGTSKRYRQDILNRRWAGPHSYQDEEEFTYSGTEPYTMADGTVLAPGDKVRIRRGTVNGETIVISRSGQVISGQHRLIALILACQLWKKQQARWKDKWPEEPFLETAVIYGVSDMPEIIQTLDNVRTRTFSDTAFTSKRFRDFEDNAARREATRYLGNALDLMWERVVIHEAGHSMESLKTSAAEWDFLERHPRLDRCVRTIYDYNHHNDTTPLTNLRLYAGWCAAALYLMGSSSSDIDVYRNADPPSEKQLDWERWDRACEFFYLLSRCNDKAPTELKPVRMALGRLVDPDKQVGGTKGQKLAILAKAWEKFAAAEKITEADLKPQMKEDAHGVWQLVENPLFGGIDLGKPVKQVEVKPTKKKLAEQKAEIRKKNDELLRQKAVESKQRAEEKKAAAKQAAKNGPLTAKQVQEEQTRKAREADEEAAREKEVETTDETAAEEEQVEESEVEFEHPDGDVETSEGEVEEEYVEEEEGEIEEETEEEEVEEGEVEEEEPQAEPAPAPKPKKGAASTKTPTGKPPARPAPKKPEGKKAATPKKGAKK